MNKSSSGYAEGQIRVFLADLASSSHATRAKAVKRFQDYVAQFKPDLSDDDVVYLFVGTGDGDSPRPGTTSKRGLLYYAGMDSGKHGGQLKRIAAPAIGLVRWLVTLAPFGPDPDNLYNMLFEIFVTMTVEELSKINFVKHILGEQSGSGLFGDSRAGSAEDALEILSLLMREHRTPDGDHPDPIDPTLLLGDNKACRDRLNQYMQKSNSEVVTKAMQQFKAAQTKAIATKWDDARPKKWEEENFKPVPVQEGEEGDMGDVEDDVQVSPIPDPLGLSELDLRATQKLNASGRLTFPSAGLQRQNSTRIRRNSASSMDDDDDDGGMGSKELGVASVLPQDKTFSPSLFLTLIHGGLTFDQIAVGSENLRTQLQQQNSQRENLVRVHFGLFVQCAEGLEWLKAYRKGINNNSSAGADTMSFSHRGDNGEQMLSRAKVALETAKGEAADTLKPILDRMRKMRKLKTADQVLRRLTPMLENPHKMRLALNRGDYDEVIAIYLKVQSIPSTSALRVVQGVKDSAEGIIDDLKRKCTTALMSPETDVDVLLRYAKIFAELEGDESYRENLKQCFTSQLGHFNALIEALMASFATNAYAGYCHARDLAAEAEAEAKANAAQGRASNTFPSRSSFSGGGSGGQSTLMSAQEWMPELRPEDEPFKARLASLGRRVNFRTAVGVGNNITSSTNNNTNDDDDDVFEQSGFGADPLGLLSAPARSADDDTSRPIGVILEEEAKRNHVLLACKVREVHTARLVSTITRWLPCLYRLVQEATSKPAVGGKGLWVAGDNERAGRAKINLTLNRKKGPPPLLMLGSSLVACGEAIRYAVLGMNSSSGDSLSLASLDGGSGFSSSTSLSGRDEAFEPKILKHEKMIEISGTPVFTHDSYHHQLEEPSLTRCVRDAGDLFDTMTALFQSDCVDEIKKHGELFMLAIGLMQELARGGEVTAAQRVMNRLLERTLTMYESKGQPQKDSKIGAKVDKPSFVVGGGFTGASSSAMGGGGSVNLDKVGGGKERECLVLELKRLTSNCLKRLAKMTRRPEWISQTVRDGLRKIFSGLLDEMQKESLLLDDAALARMLVKTSARNRARTVTASALQSPELLRLEADLKQGEVSDEARSEYLLDVLRACAILRTNIIPRIWRETKILFPTPQTDSSFSSSAANMRGSFGNFFSEATSESKEGGMVRSSSNTSLTALNGTSSNNLYNRLMKTVGLENSEANVNIEEVVRLESVTASNYVFYKLQSLHVVVMAGYSVLSKRESAGAWRATDSRPDGFCVPPHLSRLLLMIGREKSNLSNVLGSLMIESGDAQAAFSSSSDTKATAVQQGEKYQEFIFKEIAHGFLDIYAELVARINFNSLEGRYDKNSLPGKSDLATVLATATSANCQSPLCFGQATEELNYLVSIIRPFLRSSALPPPQTHRHSPSGAGDDYLSEEDLMKEASLFHSSVQR